MFPLFWILFFSSVVIKLRVLLLASTTWDIITNCGSINCWINHAKTKKSTTWRSNCSFMTKRALSALELLKTFTISTKDALNRIEATCMELMLDYANAICNNYLHLFAVFPWIDIMNWIGTFSVISIYRSMWLRAKELNEICFWFLVTLDNALKLMLFHVQQTDFQHYLQTFGNEAKMNHKCLGVEEFWTLSLSRCSQIKAFSWIRSIPFKHQLMDEEDCRLQLLQTFIL